MPMQGLGPFLEQAYRRWKGFISPEEARAIQSPAGTVLTLPLQEAPAVPGWYAYRNVTTASRRTFRTSASFDNLLYNYQEIALNRELADIEIVIDGLHMFMSTVAQDTVGMHHMSIEFQDYLTGGGAFEYARYVSPWEKPDTSTAPWYVREQPHWSFDILGGNLFHFRQAQELVFEWEVQTLTRSGFNVYFSIAYRVLPLVDPLLTKRRNYV